MNKITITFLLTFIIGISWSQDLKLNIGYGFATTENNFSKYNSVVSNRSLGLEFNLKKNIALSTGINFITQTGNSIKSVNFVEFKSDNFLSIPFAIKLYTPIIKEIKAFAEIGGYGSYHYLNKNEVFQNGNKSIIKSKNLGYSFGAHVSFGVRNTINSAWSYELFVNGQEDLFFSYKSSNNKVENNRVSFNFSLYRKLKK